MPPRVLEDGHGREFRYLRLSLTEACNFRCSYCLPNGYRPCSKDSPLSRAEILRLARAFAGMGIEKIRLTGGEPSLRRDLIEIVADLKTVPGLREVALTTNGFRLPALVEDLRHAGLDALNVSVDSLKPERFREITGHDALAGILKGIDRAIEIGLPLVKVNAVLLKGINDDEVAEVAAFIRDRPVQWRWIELMRTGTNRDYFARHHSSTAWLATRFAMDGWMERQSVRTGGPAKVFAHPGFMGSLGFISPYATDFCRSCNRLRVSHRGALRLCLFGEGDVPLRQWLMSDDQVPVFQAHVRAALERKPISHRLAEGNFGDMRALASIGG